MYRDTIDFAELNGAQFVVVAIKFNNLISAAKFSP